MSSRFVGKLQLQTLISGMCKRTLLARGQVSRLGAKGYQKSQFLWAKQADVLNEIGPCIKTPKQWKEYWTQCRLASRKRKLRFMKQYEKTGNTKPTAKYTKEDEDITNIFGNPGLGLAVIPESGVKRKSNELSKEQIEELLRLAKLNLDFVRDGVNSKKWKQIKRRLDPLGKPKPVVSLKKFWRELLASTLKSLDNTSGSLTDLTEYQLKLYHILKACEEKFGKSAHLLEKQGDSSVNALAARNPSNTVQCLNTPPGKVAPLNEQAVSIQMNPNEGAVASSVTSVSYVTVQSYEDIKTQLSMPRSTLETKATSTGNLSDSSTPAIASVPTVGTWKHTACTKTNVGTNSVDTGNAQEKNVHAYSLCVNMKQSILTSCQQSYSKNTNHETTNCETNTHAYKSKETCENLPGSRILSCTEKIVEDNTTGAMDPNKYTFLDGLRALVQREVDEQLADFERNQNKILANQKTIQALLEGQVSKLLDVEKTQSSLSKEIHEHKQLSQAIIDSLRTTLDEFPDMLLAVLEEQQTLSKNYPSHHAIANSCGEI